MEECLDWMLGRPEYYYKLRERLWPYDSEWGEKKKEIRNYLKKVWVTKKMKSLKTVDTTKTNVEIERNQLFQWWWTHKYEREGQVSFTAEFGRFLKRQHSDSEKVDTDDNIPPGPRERVQFVPTDVKIYKDYS